MAAEKAREFRSSMDICGKSEIPVPDFSVSQSRLSTVPPSSTNHPSREESEFVESLRILYPLINPASPGSPYHDFMARLFRCEACDLVMLARRRDAHECAGRG